MYIQTSHVTDQMKRSQCAPNSYILDLSQFCVQRVVLVLESIHLHAQVCLLHLQKKECRKFIVYCFLFIVNVNKLSI